MIKVYHHTTVGICLNVPSQLPTSPTPKRYQVSWDLTHTTKDRGNSHTTGCSPKTLTYIIYISELASKVMIAKLSCKSQGSQIKFMDTEFAVFMVSLTSFLMDQNKLRRRKEKRYEEQI